MTPEQWELISSIFDKAAQLHGTERAAYIREACAGREDLITEIESLLSAHDEAGDFIKDPVVDAPPGERSEMPTLTGKFVCHYRIERSIGRGGMGDVYLATDTRLDRLVALKRLPVRLMADPLFVKRFYAEARAAATIHHPNVATIFSVEEESDGHPFITLEYVDGRTLDAVTPPEGMGVPRFLDVFTQLADALAYAHSRGVTHRDIKPGNIMMDANDKPKILDFGLAQFADDSTLASLLTTITQPGQILGTPSYMSPEQAQGKQVDHRTDIFSLGIVMYETLTGRRPFTGDNSAELISELIKSDPTPVAEIRQDIPEGISRLISRCLEKDPSNRPRDMRHVAHTLRDQQRKLRDGTSTGSFAKRIYRETSSVSPWLRLIPVLLVVGLSIAGWFYLSRYKSPALSFGDMAMRRLSDTNKVGYAQVSADGRSVAFATFEEDGTRALFIRRTDDRNALQLVPPQRGSYWGGLAISDDGGQVYYLTADDAGTRGALYRVSSLGGPPRKLAEPANDVGGLTPDGERILLVRYGNPNKILSIKASDGSDEQEILSAPPEQPQTVNFRDPHYSSDGRSILYVRYERKEDGEYWSLEQLDLADHSIRIVSQQRERIGELAVLPGSAGLLITAMDPGSNLQQVFHVGLDDGKRVRLTNDTFYYFGISADRTGQNIVVSQRSDDQRVWVGEAADLKNLRPLDQEPKARRSVDWTPDGRLVYDGYENNIPHIWISDADGRNVQKLSKGDNYDSEPSVSGDGRYVVFTTRRTGTTQVWRMNIDGNEQVPLVDAEGSQRPRFAADRQTVVFEGARNGGYFLGKIPVTGGTSTELHRINDVPNGDPYYWADSPDQTRVAYSVWDNSKNGMKIAVEPVNAPDQKKIFDIWPSLVFGWTPDGNSIYYRERQAGYLPEMQLFTLDVSTGRSTPLLSAAPEYVIGFSYSRDGKRVALVRGKSVSNIVMLTPQPQK